jgi:acyl dehydratase
MNRIDASRFHVGFELEEHRVSITRSDIVRYQGASGDLHPIHHDDEVARRHGYAGAFSMGMLHAGILAGYACATFGPENVRRFKARALTQVWPGDTLELHGEVVKVQQTEGAVVVEVALKAYGRHEPVTNAYATFVISSSA